MEIPDHKLDTTIEDYELNGLEMFYDGYEERLAELSHDELVELMPHLHIRLGDKDYNDDELRKLTLEATWGDFLDGFEAVTGRDISDDLI